MHGGGMSAACARGHAGDAPDRRYGRGVPHCQGRNVSESARILGLRNRLWNGLKGMDEVYVKATSTSAWPAI